MREKLDEYIVSKLKEVEDLPLPNIKSSMQQEVWDKVRAKSPRNIFSYNWFRTMVVVNALVLTFLGYRSFMSEADGNIENIVPIVETTLHSVQNEATALKVSVPDITSTEVQTQVTAEDHLAVNSTVPIKVKAEVPTSNNVIVKKHQIFNYVPTDTVVTYHTSYKTIDTLILEDFNLVPNASFENHFSEKFAYYSKSWKKCLKSDSPDYFYFDDTKPVNMVFDEFIGGIEPKDGKGFIGIFCYRHKPLSTVNNIREYIQAELVEPLQKDSTYVFTMYVCLDAESTVSLKELGVMFRPSLLELKKEKELFEYSPQIRFNNEFLSQTERWLELTVEYEARRNDKYIIIGNFKSDEKVRTKTIPMISSNNKQKKWNFENEEVAYYYIDNISLKKINNRKYTHKIVTKTEEIVKSKQLFSTDSVYVLNNVLFEFDKSELLDASKAELDRLYYLLVENKNYHIEIIGHTDNSGGDRYNLELSQRRAAEVKDYLISKGISAQRLSSTGYGKRKPLNENEDETARIKNRRVEFKVLETTN